MMKHSYLLNNFPKQNIDSCSTGDRQTGTKILTFILQQKGAREVYRIEKDLKNKMLVL